MGRLDGKVIVISGAARGQGRAHAVTFAREGATVVGFDICGPLDFPTTPASTTEDLDETRYLVEKHGNPSLFVKLDARDLTGLQQLADVVFDQFGRVDGLAINHGIWTVAPNSWELEEANWQESIDVLLTGPWKICKAFVPKILEGDRGGSIVITGSVNSIVPMPSAAAYTAAKHGLVGLGRVLAIELGSHHVRVNLVLPGAIGTPMLTDGGTMERGISYQPEWWANTDRSMIPLHPTTCRRRRSLKRSSGSCRKSRAL